MTQTTQQPAACEPAKLGDALPSVIAKYEQLPAPQEPSGEAIRNRMAWERHHRAEDRLRGFYGERGRRYANCRLSTFACEHDTQREVVSRLRSYCENVAEHVRKGEGLILFGPKGTGKDHLLCAVARAVILADGPSIEWWNGMEFYARFRDAINEEERESDVVRKMTRPDVLCLSDPLPPAGVLTEWQSLTLFRVLDRRYSDCKPALVTVNVADKAELESRMGPQNADRLRDGAIALYCNWPSYRKTNP